MTLYRTLGLGHNHHHIGHGHHHLTSMVACHRRRIHTPPSLVDLRVGQHHPNLAAPMLATSTSFPPQPTTQSPGIGVSHPPHFHWLHAVGIASIPHHHRSALGLTANTPIGRPSGWPPARQLAGHQVGHPHHNWSASGLATHTSNPAVAPNRRCCSCFPSTIAGLSVGYPDKY